MNIRETLLKDRSSYGITAGDKIGHKIGDKIGYKIVARRHPTLV